MTASANPVTGWVLPPTPIRGLDHLGVQAPCIALYGQLLPGITNVTDRARYYSFYPWLLWQFEQRYEDRTKPSFCRVLRRAECLVALIGAHHEAELDADERDHGAAMVGRLTMRAEAFRLRTGELVDLEACEKSYFKNKLGGLGQYYFGSLRDLQILDYVDGNRRNPPGYDRNRGKALAEVFDAGVNADRFFEVLENGIVDAEAAADLVRFCPCGLRENAVEQSALVDLFLAKTSAWADDSGRTRRETLALVLDLVATAKPTDDVWLGDVLRASAYAQTLPQGTSWEVPKAWERTRSGWGAYARNELLSVALQGMFSVGLRAVERADGRVDSVEELGKLVHELTAASLPPAWRRGTVGDAIDALRDTLPPAEHWTHEDHEVQRADRLVEAARGQNLDAAGLQDLARESVSLLLCIVARGLRDNPYADFDLDPSYFSPSDLHLRSLRRCSEAWGAQPMGTWIEWLATAWGVERHLHVALRKLRAQNRDTFRVRPLDGELRLVEIPPVVFTSPRLAAARQILRDLGLIELNGENWWKLTARGQTELEVCRGA